jgi:hypothetical protein
MAKSRERDPYVGISGDAPAGGEDTSNASDDAYRMPEFGVLDPHEPPEPQQAEDQPDDAPGFPAPFVPQRVVGATRKPTHAAEEEEPAPPSDPTPTVRRTLNPNDPDVMAAQYYAVEGVDGEAKGTRLTVYRRRSPSDLIRQIWAKCNQQPGVYRVELVSPTSLRSSERATVVKHYYLELPAQWLELDQAPPPGVAEEPAVLRAIAALEGKLDSMSPWERQQIDDFRPDQNGAPVQMDDYNDMHVAPTNEGDTANVVRHLLTEMRDVRQQLMASNSPRQTMDIMTVVERGAALVAILAPPLAKLIDVMKPKESTTTLLREMIDIGKSVNRPGFLDLTGSMIAPLLTAIALTRSGAPPETLASVAQGLMPGSPALPHTTQHALPPPPTQQPQAQPSHAEPHDMPSLMGAMLEALNGSDTRKGTPNYWASKIAYSDLGLDKVFLSSKPDVLYAGMRERIPPASVQDDALASWCADVRRLAFMYANQPDPYAKPGDDTQEKTK